MELDLTLGEAIHILRRRKGWTQAQLASEAGVTRVCISNAERDAVATTVSTLSNIFAALDCSVHIDISRDVAYRPRPRPELHELGVEYAG